LNDPISTEEFAELVAWSTTDLSGVALLSVINVTITTEWECAVDLAMVGRVGVVLSFIAELASVDDTITASWAESVSSTGVGSGVGVEGSVVAFLKNGTLDQAIVPTALRKLGNVEVELGDEAGLGLTSVEQDGNANEAVSIEGSVEELSFQVSVNTVDGVLGRRVELDSAQGEAVEGVGSVDHQSQRSSSVDKVNAGERVRHGWQSEGGGTDTRDGGGDDVDGGLNSIGSVTSAGRVEAAGKRPFAGIGVVPCWANEGVSKDGLQLAVSSAFFASGGSIVALFALVGDGVTARGESAVGSASVGFPVRVQETTQIALFTSFLDTVTALWWWGITRSSDLSGSELLDWSAANQTVRRLGEGIELVVVNDLWLVEDQPLDVLRARWVGDGSLVVISGSVLGDGKRKVDIGSDLSLSAVVGDTEERATVHCGIRVSSCKVALLTVGRVDDTIAAVWLVAVSTASVGFGVGVVGTIITLFAGVDNTITAEGELAVGSADISNVGVSRSEIALFASRDFEVSVTAFKTASGVATVAGNGVVIVASFVAVNDTITTFGENAVHSASVLLAVAVGVAVIALLNNIDDTITTNWVHAVGSASVGEICVVATMIALLSGAVVQSATALLLAFIAAPPIANVHRSVGWGLGVD